MASAWYQSLMIQVFDRKNHPVIIPVKIAIQELKAQEMGAILIDDIVWMGRMKKKGRKIHHHTALIIKSEGDAIGIQGFSMKNREEHTASAILLV